MAHVADALVQGSVESPQSQEDTIGARVRVRRCTRSHDTLIPELTRVATDRC